VAFVFPSYSVLVEQRETTPISPAPQSAGASSPLERRRYDAAQFLGVVGGAPDGGGHVGRVRQISFLGGEEEKGAALGRYGLLAVSREPEQVRAARGALRECTCAAIGQMSSTGQRSSAAESERDESPQLELIEPPIESPQTAPQATPEDEPAAESSDEPRD